MKPASSGCCSRKRQTFSVSGLSISKTLGDVPQHAVDLGRGALWFWSGVAEQHFPFVTHAIQPELEAGIENRAEAGPKQRGADPNRLARLGIGPDQAGMAGFE